MKPIKKTATAKMPKQPKSTATKQSLPVKAKPTVKATSILTIRKYIPKKIQNKLKATIAASLIHFIFLKYCKDCQNVIYALKHYCILKHIIVPTAEDSLLAFLPSSKHINEIPASKRANELLRYNSFIPYKNLLLINCERYLHSFNVDSNILKNLGKKEVVKTKSALVMVDDILYALGGKSANKYEQHTCESYNAISNQWSKMPDCIRDRSDHAACYHCKCLYATGGIHITYATNTIEKYTFATSKWIELNIKASIPSFDEGLMVSLSPSTIIMFSGCGCGVDVYKCIFKGTKLEFNKIDSLVNVYSLRYNAVVERDKMYLVSENYQFITYDILNNSVTMDSKEFGSRSSKLYQIFHKGGGMAFEDEDEDAAIN